MSATDYLSTLNYGTSTGGSAGAAETSSTIGTARLDYREPPSQYQIAGLQITRLVELATLISSDLKGGTRVRVRKQSSNPFGASESGFYISQAGTGYVVVDGSATALGAGSSTGNYSFSSDAVDLSGAAVMSIAPTTATAILLGKNTSMTGAATFATGTGAVSLNGATTVADTKTLTTSYSSITTGQTVSISAQNTTAATAGNQKYGPVIESVGQGWKTNATAASQLVGHGLQTRPVEGAAAPTGALDVLQRIAGGAYAKIASVGLGSTLAGYYEILTAGVNSRFVNSNLDGMQITGNDLFFRNNGASYWTMSTATLFSSDGAGQIGTTAARVLGVRAYSYDTKMGAQLTAASSITPTAGFHHVTGATTISTISVANLAGNPTLVLVADGGTITWDAGGNILSTGTIAQDKAQWFIYDLAATKWVPQQ